MTSKNTVLEQLPKDSPFHAGEQQIQQRLGVRDVEEFARQVVRPYLPEQHREFHTSLPFLVAAALDIQDRPWVTLLTGDDGFITSPDPGALVFKAQNLAGDPLAQAFSDNAPVGLLGIELSTRRRNRVNGRVCKSSTGQLNFRVEQAFGNCPQYIRQREWMRVDEQTSSVNRIYSQLTKRQQKWIGNADTFFIASGHVGEEQNPRYGMDASHRGGEPGFVKVLDKQHIQFPDFSGNNHFNTLGNIVMNPRVGLLFVDFSSGSLLQLTGRATIDWDSGAVCETPGARRLVNVEVDEIYERRAAVALRWEESTHALRSLRLVEKNRETEEVTSFVFEAADGVALPSFEAGQHLPIELDAQGLTAPLSRTYSLSYAPASTHYRISVKRDPCGTVSRMLHDHLSVGALITARAPQGHDLVLPADERPVVMVSAGVGITPMLSILHKLSADKSERPVRFVHGTRNGDHHIMADETRLLASERGNIQLHFSYSQPTATDRLGRDYDREGRLDGQLVIELALIPDARYLLCGPPKMMADVQATLERHSVAPDAIHSESFGPIA